MIQAVQPLLKLLSELGLLSNPPPVSMLAARPECPIRALSMMNLLDEQKALELVAAKLHLELVDLVDPAIAKKIRTEQFVTRLEKQLLWLHKVVPLWEEAGTVVCAVCNPLDHDASKMLRFSLTRPIRMVLAAESQITRILTVEYFERITLTEEVDPDTVEDSSEIEVVSAIDMENEEDLSVAETDLPPIIKLCNKILLDAVQAGASDIHVEPMQYGMEVKYRIDGVMTIAHKIPKKMQLHLTSRMKLLAGMNISERRRPQDGRLRIQARGESVDMRVSSIAAAHGEKIVLRLLRADALRLNFAALGLPNTLEQSLHRILDSNGKLIVVTGPTGSGKTTTLYAALNYLKDGTRNIVTVEDPVEYKIPGINQIQVNDQINVTFAATLRSVLRQDPDVIMIGEIRDAETATIALQAAHTGHLVLSTLHTNDAPSAVFRLMNLIDDPYAISTGLAGVIAQRLVRKVCNDCSTSSVQYQEMHREWCTSLSIDPERLRVGAGCKSCRDTGYHGRVGIYSFLEINEKMGDLIHARAPISAIIAEAQLHGYRDLRDEALRLVQEGVTTLEEAKPFLSGHVQKEPPKVVPETVTGIKRPRVLLIEDDQNVRDVLSLLLQKEMFEVVEAVNGLDGLQKLYEQQPAIVLCDLMMPIMDGKEFLIKVRGNNATANIPVVFLTAVDSESNEVSLLDLGAQDFISKSSSSAVMMSRLRNVLLKSARNQ